MKSACVGVLSIIQLKNARWNTEKIACTCLCVTKQWWNDDDDGIPNHAQKNLPVSLCSPHTPYQQLTELSNRDERTVTNRLSHGTHSEARNSPKPAVLKVCSADSKGSVTSSQGIRGYISVMATSKLILFLNWRNSILLKIISAVL